MANQPHPETVTVSFTLPKALSDSVTRHARSNLTTKSDIIRRALLSYIPESEASAIMQSLLNDDNDGPTPPQQSVNTKELRRSKRKTG